MKMKINYALLPMKLHYLFMYGATAPLIPYLPVYAHEKLHMSYKGIGLIYTLLPFFGFIAKTVSGTLADIFKAHRTIFLSSIIVMGLSFFSLCFSPTMPTKPNLDPAKIQFDCTSPHSYLRHEISKRKCSSLKELKSSNETAHCEVSCILDSGFIKEFCKYWNISSTQCTDNTSPITLLVETNLNHLLNDTIEVFFPLNSLSFDNTKILNPICDSSVRENCTMKCDSNSLMKFLDAPNDIPLSTYSEILDDKSFWIYLILFNLAWTAFAICVVMSDTICFKLLGSEVSKFGYQRLFGSVGWGSFVILTGLLIDLTSSDFNNKNYTTAFIFALCVASIDFIVALKLQVTGSEKGKSNLPAFINLATNPRIIIFILCCYIVGTSTGLLWTYQDTFIQCLWLSLCLDCASSSILWLLTLGFSSQLKLLNGFTFGIFYTVMTSYASIMAPPGGEATVQGVVGAAFEGLVDKRLDSTLAAAQYKCLDLDLVLSVASGGFIGGALFTSYGGSSAFCYMGVVDVLFAIIHILFQIFLNKVMPLSSRGSPEAEGYAPPGQNINHVDGSLEDHYVNLDL
ncbi:hypothetical protein Anas_04057 [Armadillidium nasatum]|uniref:Major facilitator superfamily associated domain-containing protein n=1 Tax=Armadillidium nasatum TaxID=96803 RepID=A0A5N5SRG3_9CRUS|nr:hypothetical protein Anas_04057 [Armadillidium nasatum]